MIAKDIFMEQKFLTHGIIENHDKKSFRVPQGSNFPNNNLAKLRGEVRDLVIEKAIAYRMENNVKMSDLNIIEICCRIPTDTTKKAINGSYNITRKFLAKLSVGLKLDLKTANTLFRAHSGELNPTNDFDFIVHHALELKDGKVEVDEIDDFIEEVYELLGINLDRDKI